MRARLLLVSILLLALCGGGYLWWGQREGRLGKNAYALTAEIVSKGPRPPQSEGLKSVRALVRAELEKSGWVTEIQSFERMTPEGNMKFENVRARFSAGKGDPWKQPVRGILCAHIDSKFYKDKHFVGADDAASACAAIVEIAKALEEKEASQVELVFFDGEEALGANITPQDGLYGSRHYANYWRAREDKPKFGILLDIIGHKNLSIKLSSDTPAHLKDLVFESAKKEKAEQHFGMAAGPIIDDHVPLNFAGMPTVDLIGDFSRGGWWHTPGDNMKIISPKSLDISMRVALRMLRELLK
jgi:glutaminyl-peptide cyclotransferase